MSAGEGRGDPSQGIPRTRQRRFKPPTALVVPDIDDDAAERKRVLNVLAQRRYRERKKQAKQPEVPTPHEVVNGGGEEGGGGRGGRGEGLDDNIPGVGAYAETSNNASSDADIRHDDNGGVTAAAALGAMMDQELVDLSGAVEEMIDATMEEDPWVPPASLGSPTFSAMMLGSMPFDAISAGGGATAAAAPGKARDSGFLGNVAIRTTINPTALLGLPESTTSGSSGGATITTTTTQLSNASGSAALSLSVSSSPSSSSSSSSRALADNYLLPVHDMSLLRALHRMAERLNCNEFWEITAESPFFTGAATPAEQLPPNLRPTQSQLMVAHHPFIDFLPWPGVREKMLVILNLDDSLRPPNATGPLALINFAYDVEDSAEGIRIWGGDVFDMNNWEIGQILFERWWFLFDRQIIESSNRWRRMRGAPPLTLNRMVARC